MYNILDNFNDGQAYQLYFNLKERELKLIDIKIKLIFYYKNILDLLILKNAKYGFILKSDYLTS